MSPAQVSSFGLFKFFKNLFLTEYLRTTAFRFFCSFYCFLPPGELTETSFFSIFGHVLFQLSNVMTIWSSCCLNDLVITAWEHTFLLDTTWNLVVFCRVINISICTSRIFVLHCPAISVLSWNTSVIRRYSIKKMFLNIS